MLRGYVISDIHYGAMNPKELSSQLKRVFIRKLKNDKENIDLVVICGDLLDHKLSFNSDSSKQAIDFVNMLVALSKKRKFAVRIVKGTKNHDLDQLNNFLYLQRRADIDFKIVNVVSDEVINGTKILYVPEEYMEEPKEYYKDYFDKKNKYDICFLHGTFNHIEFVSHTIESEKPISTAPIFSYKQFSRFVNGPVICGHIHIRQSYKKKIFYTGSFSRWKFGEEADKGFMSFVVDDNGEYEVKFVKNKYAPLYETIDLSDITDEEDLKAKIQDIETYKKENNIKNLRITIDKNLNEGIDTDLIKKYFSSNEEDIKVSVKNSVKRVTSDSSEMEEKYSFIFKNEYGNSSSGIAKTISKYLKIHDNITINESVIEDLLTSED